MTWPRKSSDSNEKSQNCASESAHLMLLTHFSCYEYIDVTLGRNTDGSYEPVQISISSFALRLFICYNTQQVKQEYGNADG